MRPLLLLSVIYLCGFVSTWTYWNGHLNILTSSYCHHHCHRRLLSTQEQIRPVCELYISLLHSRLASFCVLPCCVYRSRTNKGHFSTAQSWRSVAENTHTHTHTYIYIYIFKLSYFDISMCVSYVNTISEESFCPPLIVASF